MPENCPVCKTILTEKRASGLTNGYDCPRCGRFVISDHTEDLLPLLYDREQGKDDEGKTAVISHAIRKMQKAAKKGNYWPTLDESSIIAILKQSLPTPSEQKDIFIRWVGDNIKGGGDYIKVNSLSILAIIGARTLREFYFILDHLKKENLVESKTVVGGGVIDIVKVTLSFSGLEYYEELKRSDTDKQKSFMTRGSVSKEQTDEICVGSNGGNTSMEYDVFISHASEDKGFVGPLAEALVDAGLKVWYDEFILTVGDSLRRSINKGLANSCYGIVIISPAFLNKDWPQKELDGLSALEVGGRKVILPVWHEIGVDEVRRYSPTLADRVATSSKKGLEQVVIDLLDAMELRTSKQNIAGPKSKSTVLTQGNLTEEELKLLLAVEGSGNSGCYFPSLVQTLGISETRTKYYLDKLSHNKGLLNWIGNMNPGVPDRYTLTRKGRDFLVEGNYV